MKHLEEAWNYSDCSVDNFWVVGWVIHQLSTVVHNGGHGREQVKNLSTQMMKLDC